MKTFNFGKSASIQYRGRFADHGDFLFVENGSEIKLSGTFEACSKQAIKMFRSIHRSCYVRAICTSDDAYCFRYLTVGENYISMSVVDN